MVKNVKSPAGTIVLAGLLTGTLDITAALLQYYIQTGKDPGNVLRFIASAVFGAKAFTGGMMMALWGLLFHYCIAFLFATAFFLIYPLVPPAQKNRWLTGIVYGLLVWALMNLLVVPASQAPPLPFRPGRALIAAGILVLCIGWPLSFLANKYYLYKKQDPYVVAQPEEPKR